MRLHGLAATALTFASLFAACGGGSGSDLPQVDCATPAVPTFAEVTIWPKCTGCHASTLTGAARNAAPENVNFDSYAAASASAERAVREVHGGRMPAQGTATDAEQQSLYRWALCGRPQ